MPYRSALKKNYQAFTTYIEDIVWGRLCSHGVISLRTKEKIEAINKQKGLSYANDELWTELLHCTEEQLETMIEVLEGDENQKYKGLVQALKDDSGHHLMKSAATPQVTDTEHNDQVQLQALSEKISQEYSSVGVTLGMTFEVLKQIEHDNPRDCVNRNMTMLTRFWKSSISREDKISKLQNAFSKARRTDIAMQINKMFDH